MNLHQCAKYTGMGLAVVGVVTAPLTIGGAVLATSAAVAQLGNALLSAAEEGLRHNTSAFNGTHFNQTDAARNETANSTSANIFPKLPAESLYKSAIAGGVTMNLWMYLGVLDGGEFLVGGAGALGDSAISFGNGVSSHRMNPLLKGPLVVSGSAVVGVTGQLVASGVQKIGNKVWNNVLAKNTTLEPVEDLPMVNLAASNATGGLVAGAAAGLLLIGAVKAKALYDKAGGERSSSAHQRLIDQDGTELRTV